MAYPSTSQDPMADEYMEDIYLTQEMLPPGFSTTISQDRDSFNFGQPALAAMSTSTISTEEQKADMQSILDIFQLDEELSAQSGESEFDDGDESEGVDLEDRRQRTERLKSIYPALDRLWWSGSEYMAGAAEKLADGSRDPRWRVPIGDSGILASFLAILATEGVNQSLMIHGLRLVGNSCADTDQNRERVVSQGHLPFIIQLLQKPPLLPFVIPVLFNICVDYEPAQGRASEANLTKALIPLIYTPSFIESRSLIGYICKLLDLMVTQPREIELAPENTPEVLLNTAFDPDLNCDLDEFIALSSCAIAYLRHERFQQAAIKTSAVQLCFRGMMFSYTRFEGTTAQTSLAMGTSSPDQGDAKSLTIMRSNMNQVLSDISALPEFAATYPVLSPFSSGIRRFLSSPQLQLQVMACIVLGNIARSDNACEEFVHTAQIHKPLITILEEGNDSQALYAALGFLKNLALPLRNKEVLGEAGLLSILPRLWDMSTLPQIQYSAISLARNLLNGNFANVRLMCTPLSEDKDSPAHERSRLSILMALFQRTDAEPIKMEIARLLTAVCRLLTSPSQNAEDVGQRRKQFFNSHPDVKRPLSFMISQKKWPAVRSEGWFAMALMARIPEGAILVNDILYSVQVFQPLVELLTGQPLVNEASVVSQDSPMDDKNPLENATPGSSSADPKEAQMAHIDRENAMVMVSEVLRHCGSEMADMRRSIFEDLLKDGGVMHLSYQQVKEREALFDGTLTSQKSASDGHDIHVKSEKDFHV